MTTRAFQAAAGLLTMVVVSLRMDPVTQGYFYTFLALISFLPLAEFGVSYAVMQSASHRAASVRWTDSGLTGDPEALRYTTGLFRVAQRLNAATTFIAIVLLTIFGTRVLRSGDTVPPLLVSSWSLLLVSVAAWQLLSPRIALLEGSGLVDLVWRFRVAQEIVGALVLLCGLLAGLGLLSLAASWTARLAHAALWLSAKKRGLPPGVRVDWHEAAATWRHEVWTFQWRIGLSVACGFLIYQLFAPVLLSTQGAVVAGRFGMALVLTNGLLNATSGWLNSQAPHFGHLVAARKYAALDEDFAATLRRSTAVSFLGAVLLTAAVGVLPSLSPRFAARLLPAFPFGLLAATVVMNHVVYALAVYLRAHRREPLLLPTVIGSLTWTGVLLWAATNGSATLVAGTYCGLTLLGLILAVTVFFICRARWHVGEQTFADL